MNIKVPRVFRIGQTFMNEKAKEYGLSSGLFDYLVELSENDGLTMQELSKAVAVDNGLTTRMVKKLVELGFVQKTVNPLDSRSSQVFLTDQGRAMSQVIQDIFLEWKNIVTKDVEEEELKTVIRVFEKLYENAKTAIYE